MPIRAGVNPTIDDMTLIAGQSLGLEMDTSAGWQGLAVTLAAETAATYPAKKIDATGGSSILKAFRRTDIPNLYWYDEDTASNGPLLTQLLGTISGMSITPQRLAWIQGEQDADQMTTVAQKDQYKDGFKRIVSQVRAALPSLPVYLGVLGRRAQDGSYPGWRLVRQAHIELVAEVTNCTLFDRYHVELRDSVHPTEAGYREMGANLARAIAAGDRGPIARPDLHTVSGNVLTLPIEPVAGKALAKPASPDGFRFFSGQTEIAPTSIAWSGDSLAFTFAASPVGHVAYYLHEQEADLDASRLIRHTAADLPSALSDVGAMPLRSFAAFSVTG